MSINSKKIGEFREEVLNLTARDLLNSEVINTLQELKVSLDELLKIIKSRRKPLVIN